MKLEQAWKLKDHSSDNLAPHCLAPLSRNVLEIKSHLGPLQRRE